MVACEPSNIGQILFFNSTSAKGQEGIYGLAATREWACGCPGRKARPPNVSYAFASMPSISLPGLTDKCTSLMWQVLRRATRATHRRALVRARARCPLRSLQSRSFPSTPLPLQTPPPARCAPLPFESKWKVYSWWHLRILNYQQTACFLSLHSALSCYVA